VRSTSYAPVGLLCSKLIARAIVLSASCRAGADFSYHSCIRKMWVMWSGQRNQQGEGGEAYGAQCGVVPHDDCGEKERAM